MIGPGARVNSRILVVEDETSLLKMICDYLDAVGYDTAGARDGTEALMLFHRESFDLVVTDLMMPGRSGWELAGAIRQSSDVPIIMLTARDQEEDLLSGFDAGADDYMVKPFSFKELEARIGARLRKRRIGDISDRPVFCGELEIDESRRRISFRRSVLKVTAAQFELLALMAKSPGRVFSREELVRSFQPDYYEGYDRTIDVHIKNLRKILREAGADDHFIETVRGIGYRMMEQGA